MNFTGNVRIMQKEPDQIEFDGFYAAKSKSLSAAIIYRQNNF